MKCQREKFQLQRKYAYINCAYMSPLLKKVENAGIKGIKKKRKPFQISPDDFFHETETVRLLFSQLIENDVNERVVIIPSVSYGMANVINNLPFNDGEVIITDEQFPSNVYPWMSLKENGFDLTIIPPPNSGSRGEDWNNEIINSINDKTRVVSIGHVHWSDGTLFLLEKIRARLDEVGGLLIIDGTQSIGALPFSIKKFRPDAVICAGYKWLMGPYSIGLAYYGPVFDEGSPVEENWINRIRSEDFSRLIDFQTAYREHALRYEVGEHSNFILIPMIHAALKQVLKWGPANVQEYCSNLTKAPLEELSELGYQTEHPDWRGEHLFGIRLPEKVEIEALQKSLKKHRVSVSVRGDAIRVAPHVYNDEMDMRKLLKAMKEPILAQKN
ncbi:MAG: aminotransferase class V-fold PLP-dependent enzyme [Cyclobacteriaceae bacterium]